MSQASRVSEKKSKSSLPLDKKLIKLDTEDIKQRPVLDDPLVQYNIAALEVSDYIYLEWNMVL